jgi:glutathione peroxidase
MRARRNILIWGASFFASAVLPRFGYGAANRPARSDTGPMSSANAFAFSFKALDGGLITLAEHAGQPVLIVNTASQCGYTPQFAGLEALWQRYKSRGLLVLGVPSNDFGGQEPGAAADIAHTARDDYHVSFPLTEKTSVKGPSAHPFYRWVAQQRPLDTPRWNFHKYLVDRTGHLSGSFGSAVTPDNPSLIAALEVALGAA